MNEFILFCKAEHNTPNLLIHEQIYIFFEISSTKRVFV